MEAKRNAYRVLVVNPGAKRPLGRPRCRWEDNNIKEIGEGGMDSVNLAQDRETRGEIM
jgi:hypothetical protein